MPTPSEFANAHRAQFAQELCDLIRIPSVSTLPAHRDDMTRAADWVAHHLTSIGMTVDVIPTERHPLVYAERLDRPGRPTVLGYGHYDVQPVDPLELWETPPFEPAVRNGALYARGASDDKGQMFTLAAAVRAYLETKTPLPVNVKLIIEGGKNRAARGSRPKEAGLFGLTALYRRCRRRWWLRLSNLKLR